MKSLWLWSGALHLWKQKRGDKIGFIHKRYEKNMTTITISKKLIKNDDLIVLPRKEYEKLLARRTAKQEIKVKRSASFRVPKKHEKFYEKLDEELTKALKECEEGKCYGPFETIEEGKRFLESRAAFKK